MDEKENTKSTNVTITFIEGNVHIYSDVTGYQVTQSVIAISEGPGRQTIIPLSSIEFITVTVKE